MHGGTQTICFWAFGGYNMSTGGVKAHVAACGCKAGWFEMFPRLWWLDWFVPEHHLSMYWFKVSFLRGVSPRSTDLGNWLGSA